MALPDELTGAFIEVAEYDGASGTELTIVGSTTADVSIDVDQTRAEAEKHEQRRQISKPTYNEITLEIPHLITAGVPGLEDFGALDSSGEEQYATSWAAAVIKVYETDDFSVAPEQQFEFEDVEWEIDTVDLGSDFGEITMTGYVHGAWRSLT